MDSRVRNPHSEGDRLGGHAGGMDGTLGWHGRGCVSLLLTRAHWMWGRGRALCAYVTVCAVRSPMRTGVGGDACAPGIGSWVVARLWPRCVCALSPLVCCVVAGRAGGRRLGMARCMALGVLLRGACSGACEVCQHACHGATLPWLWCIPDERRFRAPCVPCLSVCASSPSSLPGRPSVIGPREARPWPGSSARTLYGCKAREWAHGTRRGEGSRERRCVR